MRDRGGNELAIYIDIKDFFYFELEARAKLIYELDTIVSLLR